MSGLVGYISLVLDTGMLIAGIGILIKGSLPARLLETLLGEGDYRTDARTTRFIGSLLTVPFGVFILAVVLTVIASEQVAIIFSTIHFIVFIIVILTVVLWARQIRNVNRGSE